MYHTKIAPGKDPCFLAEREDLDLSIDETRHDDASLPDLQINLAQLAAGLDAHFLQAGTTLVNATEAIDRVISALDRVTGALDEQAAGAAAATLSEIAERLVALPAAQAARETDLTLVLTSSVKIRDGVLEMRRALYVLRIYGVNIKIAASGAEEFVHFVDGMGAELEAGEKQLESALNILKALDTGVSSARQAEGLLAAECAKVVPLVPRKLVDDACALRAHLAAISEVAQRVKVIAQAVQGRVAIVLGALQVGDSTRQRLEHIVAALQVIDTWTKEYGTGANPIVPPIAGYMYRMLSAQLEAATLDFGRDADLLIGTLAALGPEAAKLLALIENGGNEDGGAFLHHLERGIAEVERVTFQLNETDSRLRGMVGAIAGTLDRLTERFESLRRIRFDVRNIAINTLLMSRRFGMIGNAVSIIAKEVDISSTQLGVALDSVVSPVRELGSVSLSMREAQDVASKVDASEALAGSLATIRDGCQRTDRGINEGRADARQVIEMLDEAEDVLRTELALGSRMMAAAATLASFAESGAVLSEPAFEPLRGLLDSVSRLYTMKQERNIHALYVLPGTELVVAAAESGDAFTGDEDDGLF